MHPSLVQVCLVPQEWVESGLECSTHSHDHGEEPVIGAVVSTSLKTEESNSAI